MSDPPVHARKPSFFSFRGTRGSVTIRKPVNAIHAAIQLKNREELGKALRKRSAKTDVFTPDQQDRIPLVVTIQENNATLTMDILEFYLKNNLDINNRDANMNTALHIACQEALLDERIITGLLNHPNIDVRATNVDGNTPLHYFCEKFTSPTCQEYIDLFVKRGADVNAANNFGETLLHKACLNQSIRLILVNLLIERGANVNKVNGNNEGPLHFAVRMNREDLVAILLKAGADTRVKAKKEQKTPLELCRNKRIYSRLKKVEDLFCWLESVGPEIKDLYGTKLCSEELFLEILPEVSEGLLEKIGIDKAAHRMVILREAKKIQTAAIEDSMPEDMSSMRSTGVRQNSGATLTPKNSLPDLKRTMAGAERWIVQSRDIEFVGKAGAKERIGTGASGKVYKAIFQSKEDVAVKILKPLSSDEQVEEFKKEFEIMCAVRDPNIVRFFGACFEPKLSLVMEYCERDTLFDVLSNEQTDIGWTKFFKWTIQFTHAMICLHQHNPQVLHRDFKSLNILITHSWDSKVCDFGLSRFNTAEAAMTTLTNMRGTLTHMAPEICPLNPDIPVQPYNIKCDVYSMGIVLWEIFKRVVDGSYSKPWYSEHMAGAAGPGVELMLIMKAQQGLRPTIESSTEPTPGKVPPAIEALYKDCVDPEPAKRPSCPEMLKRLMELKEVFEANRESWIAYRTIKNPPANPNALEDLSPAQPPASSSVPALPPAGSAPLSARPTTIDELVASTLPRINSAAATQ